MMTPFESFILWLRRFSGQIGAIFLVIGIGCLITLQLINSATSERSEAAGIPQKSSVRTPQTYDQNCNTMEGGLVVCDTQDAGDE